MTQPEEARKQPRQTRSQATVDTILEAAARVFDACGYDGATTNRVADRAGVSIGSLYQYFPNKDALLTALHERHSAQVLALVRSELDPHDDAPPPLPAVLLRLARELIALHRQRPRLQRVLHTERPWLQRAFADSAASRELLRHVAAWLATRQAELTARDLPAAALTLMRMVESMVHATVLDPLPRDDDETGSRAVAEAALGYLVLPRPVPAGGEMPS